MISFTPTPRQMKPREAWGCTPAMHVGAKELTENKEKAQAFLETFFPEMDEPHKGQLTQAPWNSRGSPSPS